MGKIEQNKNEIVPNHTQSLAHTLDTLQYESTNKSLLNSCGQRSAVLCCAYGWSRTSRKPTKIYTNETITHVRLRPHAMSARWNGDVWWWPWRHRCEYVSPSTQPCHAHTQPHRHIAVSPWPFLGIFVVVVDFFDSHCVRLSSSLFGARESASCPCTVTPISRFVVFVNIIIHARPTVKHGRRLSIGGGIGSTKTRHRLPQCEFFFERMCWCASHRLRRSNALFHFIVCARVFFSFIFLLFILYLSLVKQQTAFVFL